MNKRVGVEHMKSGMAPRILAGTRVKLRTHPARHNASTCLPLAGYSCLTLSLKVTTHAFEALWSHAKRMQPPRRR